MIYLSSVKNTTLTVDNSSLYIVYIIQEARATSHILDNMSIKCLYKFLEFFIIICFFYNVVIMATWGGVGCNLCVVYITSSLLCISAQIYKP